MTEDELTEHIAKGVADGAIEQSIIDGKPHVRLLVKGMIIAALGAYDPDTDDNGPWCEHLMDMLADSGILLEPKTIEAADLTEEDQAVLKAMATLAQEKTAGSLTKVSVLTKRIVKRAGLAEWKVRQALRRLKVAGMVGKLT